MNNQLVFLLISVCVLPHIAETIYSPSLPDITISLSTTAQLTQWTLTTFLFGFAFGIRLWGELSDKLGRKKTLLLSYSGFLLSCMLGYFAPSIETLLLARFFQGLFGSVGSCVPHAMFAEHLPIKPRSIVLARIGQVMAIGPAIGPAIGIYLTDRYGWHSIFIFLLFCASILLMTTAIKPFPEDHKNKNSTRIPNFFRQTFLYTVITGTSITTGLYFFNQSGFYFQKLLGLSDLFYQNIFLGIALAWYLGGKVSEYLIKHRHYSAQETIIFGASLSLLSSMTLYIMALILFPNLTSHTTALITLALIMLLMIGTGCQIGNSIAIALTPFSKQAGQAASRLGFSYYVFSALLTYIAIALQPVEFMTMPRTLFIFCTILGICAAIIKRQSTSEQSL